MGLLDSMGGIGGTNDNTTVQPKVAVAYIRGVHVIIVGSG